MIDTPTPLPMTTRTIQTGAEQDLHLQRCVLVQVEGPAPGQVVSLDRDRLVFGQSPDVDVPIPDATVSRKHFKIENESGRYLLKDLGSTNGTRLDGGEVREAYLRPGALVQAGEVVFRFGTEYDPVRIAPMEQESYGGLKGRSVRMREIFALLERMARTDSTVLLCGPTGCGKGAIAETLHRQSQRKKGSFVVVDCGSVSRTLIESELFGHTKGSFTGAVSQRAGALEESRGGTLFLDEMDDLPLELQPKLLRAIEERVFQRLGSNKAVKFDARIVAASKKDLWQEVEQGRFREDLFFRLSVVTVRLPPLGERPEDIPLLYDAFAPPGIPRFGDLPRAQQARWLAHAWPGNVRELRNAVERSVALEGDGLLEGLVVPATAPVAAGPDEGLHPNYELPFKEAKEQLLEAFERAYLGRLMAKDQGGIAGAARAAGIDRKHLYTLLAKHGLDKENN